MLAIASQTNRGTSRAQLPGHRDITQPANTLDNDPDTKDYRLHGAQLPCQTRQFCPVRQAREQLMYLRQSKARSPASPLIVLHK
jgi:hypothetical protein